MLKQLERESRNVNDLFYEMGSVADVKAAGKRKQKCE